MQKLELQNRFRVRLQYRVPPSPPHNPRYNPFRYLEYRYRRRDYSLAR
jgi:hypothetical protein